MSANIISSLPLGPLDAERSELLLRVVEGLEPASLQWLSGFAAGRRLRACRGSRVGCSRWPRRTGRPGESPRALPSSTARRPATASASPSASAAAPRRQALRRGCMPPAAIPLKDLAKERLLVVVVSTHGDGDPPDDARGFLEFLASRRAPKLEQLSYAVLALGDSSYPRFCETGRQVDERLAALGAKRLFDRVDCDVDYEKLATPWLDEVVTGAREALGARRSRRSPGCARSPSEPQFSREKPFPAEVLANQRITARDATKDVRHIEIDLAGSGLKYEPGDALGVWHENPRRGRGRRARPRRASTGAQDRRVRRPDEAAARLADDPPRDHATDAAVPRAACRAPGDAALAAVLKPGNERLLRRTLKDLQVVDVLQRHPAAWERAAFVEALRPLAPRLYSIASSSEAVGDEAHLTVAVIDYEIDGQRRHGAASAFLAEARLAKARRCACSSSTTSASVCRPIRRAT